MLSDSLPPAIAIATAAAPPRPRPGHPASLQRERRVLIVFAPDQRDARLARQMALIEADPRLLATRDVHVVQVVGDSVAGAHDYAGHMRARYGVPGTSFEALLIGRDGSVKLRTDEAIALPRLTATIDAAAARRASAMERPAA